MGESSATLSGTDVPLQENARAEFSDRLVFSKINDALPDTFLVSLNLTFSGSINAAQVRQSDATGAQVQIVTRLSGNRAAILVFSTVSGFTLNNLDGYAGTGAIGPGGSVFNTMLVTPMMQATVGISHLLELSLLTLVSATGADGSATSDFAHTLEFPTGIDVFNLLAGYTVNAGNYLVNNRFIAPNAVVDQVPGPSSLALLGIGLGAFFGIHPTTRRRTFPV